MNPHDSHDPNSVELPEPTPWPIITAFGIALIFAGLVTNIVITLAGLCTAILGTFYWFGDVFPHPRHISVPMRPESERAAPVKRSKRSIVHLHLGEHLHRVRVPMEVHPYSAGVLGGLAGGVAMAILAVLYGIVAEGSIWYPINLLAAAGVPAITDASIDELRQFHLTWFLVAVIAHASLSILIGLLYTVLLPMLPARYAWFWGGIVTPLMWTGLIFAGIGIINPKLATLVNWPWFIICQVGFGLVGGYVVFKSQMVETMQTWPLAAKMGVEAMTKDKPK